MVLKRDVGRVIAWSCALIPILLWILSEPPAPRPSSRHRLLLSIGQLAGLTGMALLALSFVLASRARFLEPYFGGLDKMYRLHHTLGLTAFGLMLAHPVALALRLVPMRLPQALLFIFPLHQRLAVNLGSYALWGVILLIILTLTSRIPYDTWKRSHQFMGLVLLAGTLHMLTLTPTPGQEVLIARAPVLRYYMLGLAFLGLAAALYQTVLSPFLARRHRYRVTDLHRLNNEVIEIELTPEGTGVDFFPGQYVFVSFHSEELTPETHPFTICSPADQRAIRLTVKALGDFTTALYERLRPGVHAQVEGPYGQFDYRNGSSRQIWIAGGVGVAPFLSWARHLAHTGASTPQIEFYYCVHSRGDAVYHEELADLGTHLPNLNVVLICSVEQGHLHAADLRDLSDKDVFMCGPKRLTTDFRRQLRRRGVPDRRIHFEDFEFRT